MDRLKSTTGAAPASGAGPSASGKQGARPNPYADFDEWLEGMSSDSEDELFTDQEPPEFYDPDLDDKDEAWVKKQRRGRESDAVLNCPGCLTTLCIDCQRHEQYKEQYRALFVMNCRVKLKEVVRPGEKGKKGSAKQQAPAPESAGQTYHPVECALCGTEVAMRDSDEVYHFFNVFPSYA